MSKLPYTSLLVWQKSVVLAKKTHECSRSFPKTEIFGLTFQIRKCAVSIPSNIAEGSQRHTDPDFSQFLAIARGSLAELLTQILLAYEFSYCSKEDYESITELGIEISKMLLAFQRKLDTTR